MMKRGFLALCVAMLASAPARVLAVGEQNGRIEGTVTEQATSAPVPGATVTITGPHLIGGARVLTTGDDGRYEAVEMPPGRYDVEVSYSGVKPIKRRVVVRQDETVPLDIVWSPELAEAEVTVVIEERHYTKPDSTQTGTVLSQESEGKIAMPDRRYQFFAQQVAGVTPDPQNTSLFQNVKGGNLVDNRYLVDGLDLSDPGSNTFSTNVNLDLVASEEVLTGGMEAQYNALGGVFNLITAAGSDEWHVDASLYVNNSSLTAPNRYGGYTHNGYRQFDTEASPPTQKYQANLNFGGPIVKHRLWFNISAEYFYEETSQPAGPPINVQHPSYYRHQFLGHLKLTWAPSDKHRITLSAHTDPAFLHNIRCRYYNECNYGLGITEQGQNQGGGWVTLTWDYFKSQNLNFNVAAGFMYSYVDYKPEGILFGANGVDYGPTGMYAQYGYSDLNKHYNPNTPRQTNNVDGTVWYNGDISVHQPRYRVSLDPSVSIRGSGAGYHDAKIGIQSEYIYAGNEQHTPGLYTYSDNNGGPLEQGVCNTNYMGSGKAGGSGCNLRTFAPDFKNKQDGWGVGIFMQDRWKPTKRLTVVPGIRFDWGITHNSVGQTVSNLFGVGPRLGLNVDLTGDQKTIFSAYYGRANEVATLIAAGYADVTATNTVQKYDASTNTWNNQQTTGGAGGYRIDPNMKPPHTDEVTLSLRREIFRNSMAGIDYTYRKYSNMWEQVEINQLWDPSGQRVVGYANGVNQQVFKIATPDSNYRIYQGIDFYVESRPTDNWDFYAAYTLSWLYGTQAEELGQISGTVVGTSAFYNPRQKMFYDGYLPEDRRHALKTRVSYTWHGLTAGALLFYWSGTPLSVGYYNQFDGTYSNKRAPQGNDPGNTNGQNYPSGSPNSASQWSEFRLPDQLEVDLRLAYDFHALIKQHVILMADFFNLFNLSSVLFVDSTNSSSFGTVQGRMDPFRFEVGLRYLY
jgi:Carboxypeptidase regulatory-like domain/TonB dependent receptor